MRADMIEAIVRGDDRAAGQLARDIAHICSERHEQMARTRRPAVPYQHVVTHLEPSEYSEPAAEPIAPGLSEFLMPAVRDAFDRGLARLLDSDIGLTSIEECCAFCGRPTKAYNYVAGRATCVVCRRTAVSRLRAARDEWRQRESARRRTAAGWITT